MPTVDKFYGKSAVVAQNLFLFMASLSRIVPTRHLATLSEEEEEGRQVDSTRQSEVKRGSGGKKQQGRAFSEVGWDGTEWLGRKETFIYSLPPNQQCNLNKLPLSSEAEILSIITD